MDRRTGGAQLFDFQSGLCIIQRQLKLSCQRGLADGFAEDRALFRVLQEGKMNVAGMLRGNN